MNKKFVRIGCFLGACLGLLVAFPGKAAQLQLVPNWGANGVPTNLSMYVYVPDNVVTNPPVLVLLHYWGGTASSVFAQAQAGGIVAAADQYGFIMVVPQRSSDCWDYSSAQSLTHDGGGETHGIAQMVRYAITNYSANADRVYVTGDSCGGMMTEALLGVYPDMFKAGVAFAGVPIGGQWTPVTHTAQQWGDLARACYPGYTGPRPRVQLWHGTADSLVNYSNHLEGIMQWGNVLGLSTNPAISNMVTIVGVTNQWIHQVWQNTNGATQLEAWADIGGDHGPSDALFKARYVIPFLGLDEVGPLDPGASGQRGRPKLNAARTTFVAENGQPLRGPYTSTEWTSATTYDQIAKVKSLGFNAVHLYAEVFDPSYPTNGSTAPGYKASEVDKIVQSTRDLGLYLVMTIGNGANNGNHNRAYATNFWNFYASRYANESHVIFEIHNEPMAWGPSYLTGTTPSGTLDMEIAAYRAIRARAPNTPVLLFSYAVLSGSGGANAALTDIHAFNQTIFGNQNAIWTNEAVGFHGYGGWEGTATAVANLINGGYPCFMTEFGWPRWGTSSGTCLEIELTTELERLGVSWLTFQYIPPSGVSSDVTRPELFKNVVDEVGLGWTPDYGSWPVARGVYGNSGQPRATVANWVNNFLTGTLRIQAEDFDWGSEGISYHDTDSSNNGGQYYRPAEPVDISTCNDTGGGFKVAWTADGEWLDYSILVKEPGIYDLRLRYATPNSGCTVEVLSNASDTTGPRTLAATGAYTTWATATVQVSLGYGRQKFRLQILKGGFDLNWIELSPAATGLIANGNYKILNAANVLAMQAITASNTVIVSNYVGSTSQQWNAQHMGGGQFKMTSVANGWSWTVSNDSLGMVSSWNNSNERCFIILPSGGGFYRFVPVGSGLALNPSANNSLPIEERQYSGGANQRWAIIAPSTPAFPAGLRATALSSTAVSLIWSNVVGATSYSVKRSATSGGPYTTFASGVTATSYADTVPAGMKYYYVVSAFAGAVESPNSLEASVNPPYPWASQDIGSVGVAGGVNFSNGVFTVSGSGDDIWNAADAFRFVYLPVIGNCNITARVLGVQNTDGWAKAGVMIRASLTANAANAFMAVTPGQGVTWQTRSSTGGNSGNTAVGNLGAPYWVRLVRSGNTFTGYRSSNGVNWTQQGTATFTMAATAYVGLAVTAHNNSSLCTATIDNVTLPGWSNWTVASAPTGLDGVAENGQAALTWSSSVNASTYNIKRSTTNGGPYTIIANTSTTDYADIGLTNGITYYYVVSALNPAGESGNSAQTAISPKPTMSLSLSGSNLTLSWPLASVGFRVQSRTNLVSGDWEDVLSPAPQIVGDQWQVMLPASISSAATFYRIVK